MELAITITGAGAALAALVVASLSWRVCNRSIATQIVRQLNEMREAVTLFGDDMEKQSIRVTGWKTELEAVLESVETVLSQVERKRRSTAASESRMNPPEVTEPAIQDVSQLSISQLEARARQSGMMGQRTG